MTKRTRIWVLFVVVVLLLTPLPGCAGDDDADDKEGENAVKPQEPIEGSFVGEVSGTKAFVAIVAGPAQGNEDRRGIQVYVSDGERVSEWFSGSVRDNGFVVQSADGSSEAKGKLSEGSVTGTLELADGKTVRYLARRPAGAAGLYDLTVSSKGKLKGASEAGLGVTGEVTLRGGGTGMLKLADGRRLEFDVTRSDAGDLLRLGAGRVRLIVLPTGELRGAGKSPAAQGEGVDFFLST
jgi:hypothetical protein